MRMFFYRAARGRDCWVHVAAASILSLAAFSLAHSQEAAAVTGTLKNLSPDPIQLYWVDAEDGNNLYLQNPVPPGGEAAFQSYPGTTWRVLAGERLLKEFVATADANQVIEVEGMKMPQAPPAPPPAPAPDNPPDGKVSITVRNGHDYPLALTFTNPGEAEQWSQQQIQPGDTAQFETPPGSSWRVWDPNTQLVGDFEVKATARQVFAFPPTATPMPAPGPGPAPTPGDPGTLPVAGEPAIDRERYGFEADPTPAEELIDPIGAWSWPGQPEAPPYEKFGIVFTRETYQGNPELRIYGVTPHETKSKVMLPHPDPEVMNVYFLARELAKGQEVGPEYTYEDTPARLIFTDEETAMYDFRDESLSVMVLTRGSRIDFPLRAAGDPILMTGRWSFGDSRPKWKMIGIHGETVERPGFDILTIIPRGGGHFASFGELSDAGVEMFQMLQPVAARENVFYPNVKMEMGEGVFKIYNKQYPKLQPTFYSFTADDTGLIQPPNGDPIPLRRLSYWTIDPSGEWKVGQGTTDLTVFIELLSREDPLSSIQMTVTRDSLVFTFEPFLAEPNTYRLVSARRNGLPVQAGRGKIAFRRHKDSHAATATLPALGELELTRAPELTFTQALGPGQINDAAWESWIRKDQQDDWLDKKRPLDVPPEQGFVGQFLKNHQAVHHGYNVLAVDPYDLEGQKRSNAPPPDRPANFSLAPLDLTRLTEMSRPGGLSRDRRIFVPLRSSTQDWHVDQGTDLRLPNHLRGYPVQGAGGSTEMRMIFSEDSFKQHSSLKVGISSQAGSASYGRSEESEELANTETVLYFQTGVSYRYWINLAKRFVELERNFVDAVNALPNHDPSGQDPNQLREYIRFFEEWGTHYPISTLYGARATFLETRDASQTMKTLTEETTSSASVPLGKVPATVDVEASTGSTTQSVRKQSKDVRNWRVIGTDQANVSIMDQSVALGEGSSPIKVNLSPIYELLLPRLFQISDDASRQNLQARKAIMEAAFAYYLKSARPMQSDREPAKVTLNVNSIELTTIGEETVQGSSEIEIYTWKNPIELECQRWENGAWQSYNSITLFDQLEDFPADVAEGDRLSLYQNRCEIFVEKTKSEEMNPPIGGRAATPRFDYKFGNYRFRITGTIWDSDTGPDESCKFAGEWTSLDALRKRGNITADVKTDLVSGIGQFTLNYTISSNAELRIDPVVDPTPGFPPYDDLNGYVPNDE